jgi:general secretion pathway protein A
MYTHFYGFQEKPFSLVPDPSFLYLSDKHRMALTYLEYGLLDRLGFILLTGEIGAGKTTIVKQLFNQIEKDTEVALVFNTNVSGEELLELILHEFQVERPRQGKPGSLNALNRFLIEKYSMGKKALLIIDEAQNLSNEALEDVRMLTNLQTEKDSLLQILLVGQPALRTRLKQPALAQLSQRIGVSYHISPLSLEETQEYINHRLERAGAMDTQVFTPEAVTSVFDWSGGIPRTINILCDGALVYGYADALRTIDAQIVEQVVKDKQELGIFSPTLPEHEIPSPDNGNVLRRLESLEEQTTALAGRVTEIKDESKYSSRTAEDSLVQKLEAMLAAEQKRAERFSVEASVLRTRFNSTEQNAQPPEGASTSSDDVSGAPSESNATPGKSHPEIGWTRRLGNSLRKWFLP